MRIWLAVFLLGVLNATAADVSVWPATPKQNDLIRLQVARGVIGRTGPNGHMWHEERNTKIAMANNRITVTVSLYPAENEAIDVAMDYPIGVLPPGEYEVTLVQALADGTVVSTMPPVSFTVAPRKASEPLWNNTDLWWNPGESGIGMSITQHASGKLFALWFVYGDDKKPDWYVVPDGSWTSPEEYRGPVYRMAANPLYPCSDPWLVMCFDPASVAATPVGTLQILFQPWSMNRADFSMTIDGKTLHRTLYRQSF